MFILHDVLEKLKTEFIHSKKGDERGIWFIYTILAIIIPFTSSKTSNLLRCIECLFGATGIRKKRYYTFMASPKIPWQRLWQCLWKMIPHPLTNDRLLLALDDYINPKTGKKIFGCANIFDHAAKQNQSKYPWAQNIVSIGLLKLVKGRNHFAFSDVRRLIAKAALDDNFGILFPVPRKSVVNSLVGLLLRMAA